MKTMAIVGDRQYVQCDGKGCDSRVTLPVALRPLLSGSSNVHQLRGWLFATIGGQRRHFCPKCVPQYLEDLNTVEEK